MSDDHIPNPQPIDIRATGEELLGRVWQPSLAYLLGINVRTVQRWANGQNTIPPAIAARIGELLAIVSQCRADSAADRARREREARE